MMELNAASAEHRGSRGLKVAVIAGGLLHEREVSLRSGTRLAVNLRQMGHSVEILDLNQELLPRLAEFAPDVVWPMVHGPEGEDGSLQDLLQVCGYPYVGSVPQGCRISLSKPVAKSVVEKNSLPTPPSVTFPQRLFREVGVEALLKVAEAYLGYPVVVKPGAGGSAMGIGLARSLSELRSALVQALAYDDEVLVERFVQGTEIAASVVQCDGEARVLPLVEIISDQAGYDTDARYIAGRTEFFTPARLSPEAEERAKRLALDCFRVLELRDYARIDMMVDGDGQAWFIDANTTPGFTDMSLWPLAAQADSGFMQLVDVLVRQAARRGASVA